jgi:hypothetical protein
MIRVGLWTTPAIAFTLLTLAQPLADAEPPDIGCALRINKGEPARHFGTNGDDECDGGQGKDIMRGFRGDDVLRGMGSRDVVRGNRGGDRLAGRGGPDVVYGNLGPDLVKGSRGNDRLVGGGGHDVICLGRGTDRVRARDRTRDRVYEARSNDDVAVDLRDRVSPSTCPQKIRRRTR